MPHLVEEALRSIVLPQLEITPEVKDAMVKKFMFSIANDTYNFEKFSFLFKNKEVFSYCWNLETESTKIDYIKYIIKNNKLINS